MFSLHINSIKIIGCILAILFLVMPISQHGVQRADAITITADVSATSIGNLIKNTLSEFSNAASLVIQQALQLKEFVLDGIARNLAQTALSKMSADIINWINGGFNGSPAFITNFDEFLLGISDKAAGEFIFGDELEQLCEPIRFQVRSALRTQYVEEGREKYTPQCTTDELGDMDAFQNEGNFSAGGWLAWYELTVGSTNEVNKAYLDAASEMQDRVAEEQRREEVQANWGDGFLAKRACEFIESATGFSQERCVNSTPGAIIRDAIAFHVGEVPALRLLEIDEVNEVFGALANSLTNQAFAGAYGMLGLGGNNQYSNGSFDNGGSFTDALAGEGWLIDSASTGIDGLTEAIAAEAAYVAMQNEIIAAVDDLEAQIAEGKEDYPQCFDLELSNALEEDRANAEQNVAISAQVTEVLTQLQQLATQDTSTVQQSVVYQQYLKLLQNDAIRTAYKNEKLRIEFIESQFRPRVQEYQAGIDEEIDWCSS